jgi:uncharacterized protein YyaL (SSP411 family)
MTLEFLLRMHARGEVSALPLVTRTLDAMSDGGMVDQVGGGFHRYSTDERWHVPHFEKMLYDNAQLLRLYAHAWQATGEGRFRRVADATAGYLLREMQHPEGGFFSSQDADTEGVEGRTFVWSWTELVGLVGEDLARALGATPEGNWDGTNVLFRAGPEVPEEALETLFEARLGRVAPATDDKILAGWNGLAIAALAEAGLAFGDDNYVEAASRCAAFVWSHLVDGDGRLHRSWRGGVLGPVAVSEDHGLLADGFLSLFAATGEARWFRAARELCEALLERFEDPEHGGFFTTASDAPALVVRPKDLQDNAIPSGNSAAAEVLLRLAALTGDVRYERAAVGALSLLRDVMGAAPTGFGTALAALARFLAPPREIAVVGDVDDPRTRALLGEVLGARFVPFAVVALASPADARALAGEVPLFEGRDGVAEPTAYVCRMPVTTPAALAELL